MKKNLILFLLTFLITPLHTNQEEEEEARKTLVTLIKANDLPGVIAVCEEMPLRRFNQVQTCSSRQMRREKKTLEDHHKKPFDLAEQLGHFVMAQQIHAIQQRKEAERATQRAAQK